MRNLAQGEMKREFGKLTRVLTQLFKNSKLKTKILTLKSEREVVTSIKILKLSLYYNSSREILRPLRSH